MRLHILLSHIAQVQTECFGAKAGLFVSSTEKERVLACLMYYSHIHELLESVIHTCLLSIELIWPFQKQVHIY